MTQYIVLRDETNRQLLTDRLQQIETELRRAEIAAKSPTTPGAVLVDPQKLAKMQEEHAALVEEYQALTS